MDFTHPILKITPCDWNDSDAERSIQDVFENEVLSRFSDSAEYRRFATSLDGFGIHLPEQKKLFKFPTIREQESAMFEYWKSVNGKL